VCDSQTTCLLCNPSDTNLAVKFSGRTECQCCDGDSDLVKVGDYCYSGTDCATNCKLCASNGYSCQTCNDGYYLTSNSQCDACPSNCATCTNAGGCTSCSNSKKLLNGRCVDCTAEGQLISADNCVLCNVHNCKKCSAEGACIECKAGFWLESDDCCTECGNGKRQYTEIEALLSASVNKCASCTVSNCLYCQSAVGTCTRCSYPYFLKSNVCDTCVDTAEIQLTVYTAGGDTCQPCVPNCVECTATGLCKKCGVGFYVSFNAKATCVACSGGDDLIFNNYCLVGSDCDTNCKKCLDFARCGTCNAGYYSTGTQKKCVPCPTSCSECTSFKDCTICNSGYFKLTNSGSTVCAPCGVSGGSDQEGQSNAGILKFTLLLFYTSHFKTIP
jgi:hypothetical protein